MRSAFSLLELIFALTVASILIIMGVHITKQSYQKSAHIRTLHNATLTLNNCVKKIASHLDYRIDNTLIQTPQHSSAFAPLTHAHKHDSVEFITKSVDTLQGFSNSFDADVPLNSVSRIVNTKASSATLVSINSDFFNLNRMLKYLTHNRIDMHDCLSAHSVVAFDNQVYSWGWYNTSSDVHPVCLNSTHANVLHYAHSTKTFNDVTIEPYFDVAFSAVAFVLDDEGTLYYYDNYLPWQNEVFSQGTRRILMHNVTNFEIYRLNIGLGITVCTTVKSSHEANSTYCAKGLSL